MREKEPIPMVLCVDLDKVHTPESVKGICCKCNKAIWVSPWNKDKNLICITCCSKIPSLEIGMAEKDLKRAIKFIEDSKEDKNV